MEKSAERLLNATHSVVTVSPLGMANSRRIDWGRSARMRRNAASFKRNPCVSFASTVAARGAVLEALKSGDCAWAVIETAKANIVVKRRRMVCAIGLSIYGNSAGCGLAGLESQFWVLRRTFSSTLNQNKLKSPSCQSSRSRSLPPSICGRVTSSTPSDANLH